MTPSNKESLPVAETALCTLFEGDYHLGAAALLNSLHSHGFQGPFVLGHRGPKPPWAAEAEAKLTGIQLHWVALHTERHLTNYKPVFLQECFAKHTPYATHLAYFDPDIVVKCPWSYVKRSFRNELAVVCDLNSNLPKGHPTRLQWEDFYEEHNFTKVRNLELYFNAGFVGLPREHEALLQLWADLLARAEPMLGDMKKLKQGGPFELFHSMDQDALNMALELCQVPINHAGPEAMDFIPGGYFLSHAAGKTKPWRGGFIKEALKGYPPSRSQKEFYQYADSPINLNHYLPIEKLKRELQIAAALGRFYRRS